MMCSVHAYANSRPTPKAGSTLQESLSLLVVASSMILSNMASSGGGLSVGLRAAAAAVNSTVAGNVALIRGGGIACQDCALLRVLAYVTHNAAQEVRCNVRYSVRTELWHVHFAI